LLVIYFSIVIGYFFNIENLTLFMLRWVFKCKRWLANFPLLQIPTTPIRRGASAMLSGSWCGLRVIPERPREVTFVLMLLLKQVKYLWWCCCFYWTECSDQGWSIFYLLWQWCCCCCCCCCCCYLSLTEMHRFLYC